MKTIESAGIIVFYQSPSGEHPLYLILQYVAGHWDFPKGKLELGETKQDAAIRELKEETGLTASVSESFFTSLSYLFTDHDGLTAQKIVYFFLGSTNTQATTLSPEHTDYQWVTAEQAHALLTYDNAKKALEYADNFLRMRAKR